MHAARGPGTDYFRYAFDVGGRGAGRGAGAGARPMPARIKAAELLSVHMQSKKSRR